MRSRPGDVAPPGTPAASTVIQAALSRIGSPYSWGGSGPNAFDCSGLVMWSFQQAGISLPHSSQALARGGQPVSADQMQPGDLVTYYSDASHVGIYIGDGMMVHASTYGTPVRVAPVNNAPDLQRPPVLRALPGRTVPGTGAGSARCSVLS